MSPAIGPTVSGVWVATVLRQYGMLYSAAVAARRHSDRGHIRPDRPTGAMPNGAL